VLNPDSYCPLYVDHLIEAFNSTRARDLENKHQDFFDLLTEKSGQNVTTFYDVYDIEGGVQIERWRNLTQPDWLTDEVFQQMVEIKNIYLSLLHPDNQTIRLRGGPLLGEMLKNMLNKAEDPSNQRQIYLFTAHDATIIGLMAAMGLPYNGTNPPYTAALMAEQHLINGDNYVKILYRPDPAIEPEVVLVPGCEDLCPLTEFQKIAQPVVPTDVMTECRAS
jgi:lysosomal acid phosphatase